MQEQIREIVESTFDAWWKTDNMSAEDVTRLLVSRLAALLSQGCDEPMGCMECLYALGRPGPAYIPNPKNENCKHCTRGRTDHYTPTEPKE